MGQNESGHFDPHDETIMDRGSYRRHSFQGTSSGTLEVKQEYSRSLSNEDLLREGGPKTLSGGGGTLRRDVLRRQRGMKRKDFNVNPRWSEPFIHKNLLAEGAGALKNTDESAADQRLTMSDKLQRKHYKGQGHDIVSYDSDDTAVNIKKKRKKHERSKNKENVTDNPTGSKSDKKKSKVKGAKKGQKQSDPEVKVVAMETDIQVEPEVIVKKSAAEVRNENKVVITKLTNSLDVMRVGRSQSMTNIHDASQATQHLPVQSDVHPVLTKQTEREYDFSSLRTYYETLGDHENWRAMTLPKKCLVAPIDGARMKRAMSASDIHEVTKTKIVLEMSGPRGDSDAPRSDGEKSTKKDKKKEKKKHKHRRRESEKLATVLSSPVKDTDATPLPVSGMVSVDRTIHIESVKRSNNYGQFPTDQEHRIEEMSKTSFATKKAMFEQSGHMYDKPGAYLEKKGLRKSMDYSDQDTGEFEAYIVPMQIDDVKAGLPSLNEEILSKMSTAHPGMVENVVTKVTQKRRRSSAEEINEPSSLTAIDNNDVIDIGLSAGMSGFVKNGQSRFPLLSIPSIEISLVDDVDQTADQEFIPLQTGMSMDDIANGGTYTNSIDIEISDDGSMVGDEIIQEMNAVGIFASPGDVDNFDSRSRGGRKGQKDSVTFVLPPTFHEGVNGDLEMANEGQGRERTFSKDSMTFTPVSSLSSSCSSGSFEEYMLENLAQEKQTAGDVVKCGREWQSIKGGTEEETADKTRPKSNAVYDSQTNDNEHSDTNDKVKNTPSKKKKKHKKRDKKDKKEKAEDSNGSDEKAGGIEKRKKTKSRGFNTTDDVSVTITASNEVLSLAPDSPRAKRPASLELGANVELVMKSPPSLQEDDDMLIVLTGDEYASMDRWDQKAVLEALVGRDRSSSVKTPGCTTPLTPFYPPHDKNGVLSDIDLLDLCLVKYKAELKELEMVSDVVYMSNMEKLSDTDREMLDFIAAVHSEIYDEVSSVERQLLDIRGKVDTIPIALEQECLMVASMMNKVISLLKEQLYHNGIVESLEEEHAPRKMSQFELEIS